MMWDFFLSFLFDWQKYSSFSYQLSFMLLVLQIVCAFVCLFSHIILYISFNEITKLVTNKIEVIDILHSVSIYFAFSFEGIIKKISTAKSKQLPLQYHSFYWCLQ